MKSLVVLSVLLMEPSLLGSMAWLFLVAFIAAALTAVDLMTDRALFGDRFGTDNFRAWRIAMAVAFGLGASLTGGARSLAKRCTALARFPSRPVREAWWVVGRRGGKSQVAALVAVFMACCRRYRLAPGERGVVMLIAADRKQGRVVKRYISALLRSVPMFAALIVKETKESISLSNGIDIEIHTSSFRAIRGYTVVGAICDELAFWSNEDAADPDTEILNALRPAMATVPNALLMVISSPYARRGELWRIYERHFGKSSDDVLVWQADTLTMNPTVPKAIIDAAYEADEAVALAEYGAQFRRDIESFLSRDVLDAAVLDGITELAPIAHQQYVAFVDPSGGSADAMTLAIAHWEPALETARLDALREVRPPFSPEQVVSDFAALLQRYRITSVTGDRYAGEWPREQFRKRGITYHPADRTKSELYRDLLPLLNSQRVTLLDHPRLLRELANLERRVSRGGRDLIDHAPAQHDDLANAAAGALCLAVARPQQFIYH